MANHRERKHLGHAVPFWVKHDAVFFITINCLERQRNSLCHKETFKQMADALEHYEKQGQLHYLLFLAMPDHVHILVGMGSETSMSKCFGSWKRYLTNKAGIQWQREFFDHRIRADESLNEKAAYIRNNPVRAQLVEQIGDWPFYIERPLPAWL